MSTSGNSAIEYSSVDEIRALFKLPAPDAMLLLTRSESVIQHGRSKPENAVGKKNRASWVEQGHDKIVRISLG